MDNFGSVFSDSQYQLLNQEYNRYYKPRPTCPTQTLNSIIKMLEHNSFQMPINLQNNVLNLLVQAREILSVICVDNSTKASSLSNNPFSLIKCLAEISVDLRAHTIKSPYQILSLKSGDLILQAIKEMSSYFESKNIKIFKFI